MVRNFIVYLLGFLVVLVYGNDALADDQNKETIIWAKQNLIPFYIMDGPFKGQGISDQLQAFFAEKLPEFSHEIHDMSFERVLDKADHGQLVCSALILKTKKREKNLIYSDPLKPGYSHYFITSHPVQVDGGEIDLERFIESHEHPLIAQKGRSYGPFIDDILNNVRLRSKVSYRQATTQQLYKLVQNRQHGHFIDVESSLTYYRAINGDNKSLMALPIKGENSNRFGFSACSRSESGEEVVARINAVIKSHANSQEFRNIIESWIAPENLNQFRKNYNEKILSRIN